jgi:hypothetical protein
MKFESNLAKSLRNQVNSMPRRLEDIIRREGNPPSTTRDAVHPVNPLKAQNHLNKEIV